MVTRPGRGQAYQTRDNGGVRRVYAVNITFLVGPLARVTASLTEVAPNRKLRRGDLAGLVVFGRVCRVTRRGGVTAQLGYNGVISLKKDGTPLATRVYGPVFLEARPAGYARLAVVARGLL